MSSSSRILPEQLSGRLVVKLGNPLTAVRKTAGQPADFEFTLADGLAVVRARCLVLLRANSEYESEHLSWNIDSSPLCFKSGSNQAQKDYTILNEDNFQEEIELSWRNGTAWRRANSNQTHYFEFFIYSPRQTPISSSHRATAANVRIQADLIRAAMEEVTDGSPLGPAERAYWEISAARRPNEPLSRPENNIARQLREMDALAQRHREGAHDEPEMATVTTEINGS